jgi:3-methyladenine DNA glycosylase AlkC
VAEPLKDSFGPDIPSRIAASIVAVCPDFPARRFLTDALDGYEDLELMPRGRSIGKALHAHLPAHYPAAIAILLESLPGLQAARDKDSPMGSFIFMPHCVFVADYGVEHFAESMRANYELTKRFTAEFSIRPFITRYPDKTLSLLHEWTGDPSPDVRRLVSEGTRPRLPWASRLPEFQQDPAPVLALLEQLKDDAELYVRRSVANNLNDIGKDHPDVLVRTAKAWMKGASEDRKWLIRHALRAAVKRGDPGALKVLGYGDGKSLEVRQAKITPRRARVGDTVTVSFEVFNTGRQRRRVMVDFRVHYVKANGATSPKVFKLKSVDLAAGEAMAVAKRISVSDMSTRRHYAGTHTVEALLNGQIKALGSFELRTGLH